MDEKKLKHDKLLDIPDFLRRLDENRTETVPQVAEQPDLNLESALNHYDNEFSKIFKLMLDKNYDYGEAWKDMRISSLTDLIIQKLLRVKQIEENDGVTVVSEGVEANYHDMVNYAIFALIHLKG